MKSSAQKAQWVLRAQSDDREALELLLAMYARLAYLHWTTDNMERLLGASVAALTFLIAWAAFAIILTTTRTAKRILRAIELLSRR